MTVIPFEVSAVLFDMDGTLVDSTPVVERTWTRWALQYGLEPGPIVAFAHGRPTADTIRMAAPHLDAVTEAAQLLAEEELDPTPVRTIPGALEAVQIADQSAMWAVVTSASRKLATMRLTLGGFPKPPILICADDVQRGKPDPEGFLTAARDLGVAAAECVVFEDTPAGLQAGRAAGCKIIGLSTTFPAAELVADAVVNDLKSVLLKPTGCGRLLISLQPEFVENCNG
jgi:sugar-phosphatase